MASSPSLTGYSAPRELTEVPRLPLVGRLDLTYRCNCACLHYWLWQSPNAPIQRDELTLDEIRRIADEARALGTRRWRLSGGEPMLRPDFPDIFDYLTRKSVGYSLNTNGTLITPGIARLLTRKGSKMVALYGATAEVYDAVTRHPGGFEKAMRGFALLREAGAGFIVQLIPMRANWHQWDQMRELAQRLSPQWRIGAPWLFLSYDTFKLDFQKSSILSWFRSDTYGFAILNAKGKPIGSLTTDDDPDCEANLRALHEAILYARMRASW